MKKTAKEYFHSAVDELNKNRCNSSVVLFFKSLVALIDLYILQNKGVTPSSHTERFRLCQNNFQDVYDILDRDFPFYQDSYVHILTKELAEVVKEDVQVMVKKTKIGLF